MDQIAKTIVKEEKRRSKVFWWTALSSGLCKCFLLCLLGSLFLFSKNSLNTGNCPYSQPLLVWNLPVQSPRFQFSFQSFPLHSCTSPLLTSPITKSQSQLMIRLKLPNITSPSNRSNASGKLSGMTNPPISTPKMPLSYLIQSLRRSGQWFP